MGELEWYEDFSLESIKSTIQSEINNASSSFVSIGFYLKNVRDRELFKEDGHKDIWEFAAKEFGISKSSASRFMAINDRFSKNCNSPILQDEYKNFSSSKLQEMLTLADVQLAKVKDNTTVKEIREMKPKKKIKKETQTEVKPYTSCDAYNLKNSCIGCYYDKNDCCVFDRTDMKTVATSQQEKASNPILTKNGGNTVFKCPACGKEVKYGVDCVCGRNLSWDRYKAYEQKKERSIDDLDLPVTAFNNLCKMGITTIEQLCSHTYDELNTPHMGRYYMTRIEEALMDAGLHLKSDVEESSSCDGECFYCKDDTCNRYQEKRSNCIYDASRGCPLYGAHDVAISLGLNCIEACCSECSEDCEARCGYSAHNITNSIEKVISESDTKKTIDEIELDEDVIDAECKEIETELLKPLLGAKTHLKNLIKLEEDTLLQMRDYWKDNQPDTLLKHETMLFAYKKLLTELENEEIAENEEIEQPELPLLKNNDQRKEFIDNYQSWPVWLDIKETGERFYRYDFDNGTSIIVKISACHKWNGCIGYGEEISYGHEKYYLIGLQSKEEYKPKEPTFCESETNKSALVDYLREVQKK